MNAGFDQPLYVLPLDHRGTFLTRAFGWKGDLSAAQSAVVSGLKQVVYDGFRAALKGGVPVSKSCILADEQFGTAILRHAAERGYTTALSAEWSGGDEFDLEYGEHYTVHIESFRPTFCKALVRYNPEDDGAANARQAARLRRLCDYLHRHRPPGTGGPLLMLGLVIPPLPGQLARVRGDTWAYDAEVRPRLVAPAIGQLRQAGVEPDVWMVEGLERRDDCERVATAARQGGRQRVGCIVLGRGEDPQRVRGWLATAATVPGFIGFAVGRTTFWDALARWRNGRASRAEAVASTARRYREWVDTFEEARSSSPAAFAVEQENPLTP
jgi:5-dehydro-2-deoxygluconokinase